MAKKKNRNRSKKDRKENKKEWEKKSLVNVEDIDIASPTISNIAFLAQQRSKGFVKGAAEAVSNPKHTEAAVRIIGEDELRSAKQMISEDKKILKSEAKLLQSKKKLKDKDFKFKHDGNTGFGTYRNDWLPVNYDKGYIWDPRTQWPWNVLNKSMLQGSNPSINNIETLYNGYREMEGNDQAYANWMQRDEAMRAEAFGKRHRLDMLTNGTPGYSTYDDAFRMRQAPEAERNGAYYYTGGMDLERIKIRIVNLDKAGAENVSLTPEDFFRRHSGKGKTLFIKEFEPTEADESGKIIRGGMEDREFIDEMDGGIFYFEQNGHQYRVDHGKLFSVANIGAKVELKRVPRMAVVMTMAPKMTGIRRGSLPKSFFDPRLRWMTPRSDRYMVGNVSRGNEFIRGIDGKIYSIFSDNIPIPMFEMQRAVMITDDYQLASSLHNLNMGKERQMGRIPANIVDEYRVMGLESMFRDPELIEKWVRSQPYQGGDVYPDEISRQLYEHYSRAPGAAAIKMHGPMYASNMNAARPMVGDEHVYKGERYLTTGFTGATRREGFHRPIKDTHFFYHGQDISEMKIREPTAHAMIESFIDPKRRGEFESFLVDHPSKETLTKTEFAQFLSGKQKRGIYVREVYPDTYSSRMQQWNDEVSRMTFMENAGLSDQVYTDPNRIPFQSRYDNLEGMKQMHRNRAPNVQYPSAAEFRAMNAGRSHDLQIDAIKGQRARGIMKTRQRYAMLDFEDGGIGSYKKWSGWNHPENIIPLYEKGLAEFFDRGDAMRLMEPDEYLLNQEMLSRQPRQSFYGSVGALQYYNNYADRLWEGVGFQHNDIGWKMNYLEALGEGRSSLAYRQKNALMRNRMAPANRIGAAMNMQMYAESMNHTITIPNMVNGQLMHQSVSMLDWAGGTPYAGVKHMEALRKRSRPYRPRKANGQYKQVYRQDYQLKKKALQGLAALEEDWLDKMVKCKINDDLDDAIKVAKRYTRMRKKRFDFFGFGFSLQDLFWTFVPPSKWYAYIGMAADVKSFVNGGLSGGRMEQWMAAWGKGSAGLTKKVQRRKFRRKLYNQW